MKDDKYLHRTLPKQLEEFEDPELRKEVEFFRKKEDEAEKRIQERLKSKEPEKPIDKKQREGYKEETKNFLIALPMLLIGPLILLFAFILFTVIPGSDVIVLVLCFIAIASMIWAIYNRTSSR